MLWWPLRYLRKNDVRFVFIPIGFVKGATSGAATGAGTVLPFRVRVFIVGFCGVRVSQALVFCVVFCGSFVTLTFCPLSFDHCVFL